MRDGWGDRLERRRRELDLSQGDVATVIGVSASTLSNWGRGQGSPSVEHVEPLAAALAWPVAELLRVAFGIPLAPQGAERLPAPILRLLLGMTPADLAVIEQVARGQHAARNGKRANRERNAALLQLLYDTGLRRGEVIALQYDDIDFRNRRVRLRGADVKTGDWRVVPFSQGTKAALLEYDLVRRDLVGDDPGTFFRLDDGSPITARAIDQTVRTLRRLAGVDISTHSFRSGAIARMRREGLDALSVMPLVGHKSPVMTARYAGDAERDAAADRWAEKLGG